MSSVRTWYHGENIEFLLFETKNPKSPDRMRKKQVTLEAINLLNEMPQDKFPQIVFWVPGKNIWLGFYLDNDPPNPSAEKWIGPYRVLNLEAPSEKEILRSKHHNELYQKTLTRT